MKKNNILLINIGILAAYMIILTIGSGGSVLIASVLPIAIQVFINFILFLINFWKDKSLSYSYLLSSFLVLLIGFSSCWGLSTLAGGLRI